ncbi:hypothetical protein W04_1321 [Pseudoalteromonas sp. SW0106-04]|uniref:hypothetical protein n=1 Tax=Pseudoalteromonas sp. SW0106-04 TaxID=1702169 RepID=UPI0006B44718|nr:hypothetical protein [Pseudoalteromonas sp. SW0106-04]GAP74803.1 hypothetical protein W04_1321 [Pseudoalteromonas sp. SW0106-04]
MKWLVTLLLSLYAAALSATTIEKINLDNHCEQANFARFGEAIGDARIVMLDELTHGEQQNFALKSCLVRYLHQHQGFDALILESGLFDVAQIWQQPGQAITAQAPVKLSLLKHRAISFICTPQVRQCKRSCGTLTHSETVSGLCNWLALMVVSVVNILRRR